VGFPGETAEDFRALLAFLEETQFDRMGAFAYSPQEGTRAIQYEDDVHEGVKKDRLEEIVEVQRSISAERLERFVGREVDVLVDRVSDPDETGATQVGRVQWQADDVDGETYLTQGGWAAAGSFVRARITASEDYDFRAAALT
jgi:ribosomal protein S12 methylthiotransferase